MFTQQDEDQLVKRLHRMSERELMRYVSESVAHREMLMASMEHEYGPDLKEMLDYANVLARMEAVAREELERRYGMARAAAPYVCDLCGGRTWAYLQQNHGPVVCPKCWAETEDEGDAPPYEVEKAQEDGPTL